MQLLSAVLWQGTIRHLLNQGVLEPIARLRRHATLKDQLGGNQLIEGRRQFGAGRGGNRLEQHIGELATDHSTDLSELSNPAETIETRRERTPKGRRDG